MATQSHEPTLPGGPCKRCGLTYSTKTAYVPCFESDDTFETWAARQNEATLALVQRKKASGA